ncbi:MAG: hypothetical protein JWM90_3112 [Thermoleophilia bacterium]|nr:hypothetical protein [Thermoleophilia bacterium]
MRYRISAAAKVTYTLQRRSSPRLGKPLRTCPRKVTNATTKATYGRIATRVRSLNAGFNSIRLSQFVRVANLKPGYYHLQIRAQRSDGAKSRVVTVGVVVTAR